MNGAESLARTLLRSGVDVCFTNPGTSEMHFVAALDRVEGMRCVLGLFEGVVTGAADGYARMAGRPAGTLLHLGPGLGNGLANLHNARKAQTPVVNIVGEHAVRHLAHDAPLTADIEGIARPVSAWVKTSTSAREVARDGAEAVAAARTAPGQVATLILPADTAWEEGTGAAEPVPVPPAPQVDDSRVRAAVDALRSGQPTVLLMTGRVLHEDGLALAGKVAASTGTRLMAQMANKRIARGAGRVTVERVPYPVDQALATFADVRHIVLVGAKPPVAFFAYPGKPSELWPKGCEVHSLAEAHEDCMHALEALVDALGASGARPAFQALERPSVPTDERLSVETVCATIGALMPENAVVTDEAISTGRGLHPYTKGAPPHDWLAICGGSIGIGLPLATGAAVACPDRKVLALQADGSAMYTIQALWTQAREGLDITTLLFSNRAYGSLKHELHNVGASNPGRKALDMLEIGRPDLDFVSIARGMGVAATRVTSTSELARAMRAGLASGGPNLVEVML
ncbi:MAG: acetolactate synthase large subunit [Chromatiales bacterium]|nr:acetolactate synthase large subunit [Chromatiales bacterium]